MSRSSASKHLEPEGSLDLRHVRNFLTSALNGDQRRTARKSVGATGRWGETDRMTSVTSRMAYGSSTKTLARNRPSRSSFIMVWPALRDTGPQIRISPPGISVIAQIDAVMDARAQRGGDARHDHYSPTLRRSSTTLTSAMPCHALILRRRPSPCVRFARARSPSWWLSSADTQSATYAEEGRQSRCLPIDVLDGLPTLAAN